MSRRVAVVALGLCLAATLSSCSALAGDDPDRSPGGGSTVDAGPVPTSSPREMRRVAQAILDRRARAVRDRDFDTFARDLGGGPAFHREQRRLFDNLTQLPLQKFSYTVRADEWNTFYADERWQDRAYIPYVEQRMQLRGFDQVPIDTTFGITFAPVGGPDGDRWVVVSDTDVKDRTTDGVQEAPWDLTAIKAIRTRRVLGIFDREIDETDAQRIVDAAERSIGTVTRLLPTRWHRRVVVYALGNRSVLDRMGNLPGSDPDGLTAVSFPIFDDSEEPTRVATTRILIHPDYIDYIARRDPGDTLLTHEMTHVAVARRSGGAPTWANEGLAEWVSTRGGQEDLWRYTRDTVEQAAAGVHEMPSSFKFNTVDVGFHYSMALMACDYIAEQYGSDRLWRVWKALQHDDYARTDTQQDRVLNRLVGIDSQELAERAAEHLVERSAFSDLS